VCVCVCACVRVCACVCVCVRVFALQASKDEHDAHDVKFLWRGMSNVAVT
jgi:hypothetical protein